MQQSRHFAESIIEIRGVEAATVGTALSRPERDGWVVYLPDSDDRHGKLVAATDKAGERRDYVHVVLVEQEMELREFFNIKADLKDIIARFLTDARDGGGDDMV
ncbi:MAG: hypothetical protein WCC57_06120 [Paracoccaceae bacterium]